MIKNLCWLNSRSHIPVLFLFEPKLKILKKIKIKNSYLLRDIKYCNQWKTQKNLDPPLITWWSLLCLLASNAWFTLRTIQSNRAPYRHLAMASRVAIAWKKNQTIVCNPLSLRVVSKLFLTFKKFAWRCEVVKTVVDGKNCLENEIIIPCFCFRVVFSIDSTLQSLKNQFGGENFGYKL